MEDRNNRLIIAYFDKTIDDDGLAELKEWLESNPENQEIFSETIHILSASKSYFQKPEKQSDNWAKIQAHIAAQATLDNTSSAGKIFSLDQDQSGQEQSDQDQSDIEELPFKPKSYQLKNWLIAASILLTLSTAALITYKYNLPKPAQPITYAQFNNPNGSHSKISLPDGSVIHLGAGSKISYEKSFSAKKRLISLDGEAFFEVAHNAQRPFIVKSGKVSTVVLGTSFNIKAFAVINKVSVTVNTGKVGVVAALEGRPKMISYLLPDDQLEINTNTGAIRKHTISAEAVSGWTDNNFVYYNTSIKDIAASLERHYGVKIKLADAGLEDIKLTAKFYNLPLAEVTDNLEQLSGLLFETNGKEITIKRHQQKRRAPMK